MNGNSGSETISSAYAMHTSDAGRLHINAGLRAEVTNSSYTGHVATTPQGGKAVVTTTPGSQTYVDVFPSVQLKYALDDRNVFGFAFDNQLVAAQGE